jgi:hypothetical protein
VPVLHDTVSEVAGDSGGVSSLTYAGIVAAHGVGAVAGYNHLTKLWGVPDGRFHIKDEFGDHLAFNDEVSHVFVSYKLAQGFCSVYRGIGFSDGKARLLGLLEAVLVMTAVEFPVDAYNPSQGLGVTDLAANYAGVGLAWWRSADPKLRNFDLKASVKSVSSRSASVLGSEAVDYDNYVYWLTYRHKVPVIGLGYSTGRDSPAEVEPQLFLGIGTTIPDLLAPICSKLAARLRPLELYFFNLKVRVL